MTALPNPFLNSTATPEPPAVASTADSAYRLQNVARPDETAERDPHPNSVSPSPDLISEHAKSAVASSDLQPRATAEPFDEPPSNEGRHQETPASAPTKNPDVGVLADRIDWDAFFEAVMDERIVLLELYDEVPLFIRSGDHLRRWSA